MKLTQKSISLHTRTSSGRKALPADLPREQRIYDLTGEEKTCACGHDLTHIKDEKSEQLEIIPAKVYHSKKICLQALRRNYQNILYASATNPA